MITRGVGDCQSRLFRYRPRLVSRALQADLDTFPVVVLTGARQAGKRTLALEGSPFADRPYLT